jgi:hypothetical protein
VEKLYQSLKPETQREMPGMLPGGALSSLEQYVKALVASAGAYNVTASAGVRTTLDKMLQYEWGIEGKQWPNLPMGVFGWEATFPEAVYGALASELVGKTMEERIQWSWDIGGHFMIMADRSLPAENKFSGHRFGDSQAIWFFYRMLANYLLIVMRSLKSAGVDPKYAYTMVKPAGVPAADSHYLNEAIVDLAARDWLKLGFEDLFTPVQKEVIEKTDKQFQQRVAADWAEYAAEQAALKKRIESLTAFEDTVKAINTPFEAIRKSAGFLQDIMLFLRDVPGFVWVGAAATAGYFGFVHPRLKAAGVI